jgi:hypothetical protein
MAAELGRRSFQGMVEALFSYCGRKNQSLKQCRPLSNGNPCRISVLSAVGRGRRMMALEALVS